jgi:hypothetical protein
MIDVNVSDGLVSERITLRRPLGRFGLSCCATLAVAENLDLTPSRINNDADNCQILKRMSSNFTDNFESVDLGDAGDFH